MSITENGHIKLLGKPQTDKNEHEKNLRDIEVWVQKHLEHDDPHDQYVKESTILTGTATWNPASIANGANDSTTVTVTGATVGQPAFAGFSSVTTSGWIISAFVTATDTVTVTLRNTTGGAVDLASGTVTAKVFT